MLKVTDLKIEYKNNPLGIDIIRPRMSWHIKSDQRGQKQTAYQIKIATNKKLLNNNPDIWPLGKVLSEESVNIEYDGCKLESGTRYFWQVRVWDQQDQPSLWSDIAWWEMGK